MHDHGGRDEEHERRTRERLVVFSDAVLAIAMTLLALDLEVPTGETEAEVWHSFVDLLAPNYLAFMISFLVTARFWLTHHELFLHIDRADTRLTLLNLGCLLMIMLIPFATRVLTEDADFRLSTILYALVIATISGLFLAMVRHAVRRPLLDPSADPALLADMASGVSSAGVIFLISIPISLISPSAAQYSWLALFAVFRVVFAAVHRLRRSSRPT